MEAKLSGNGEAHRLTSPTRPRRSHSLAPLAIGVKMLARSWRLLSVILLGMLVASTLLCSVPFFSALLSSVQLQQTLHSDRVSTRNIDIHIRTTSATSGDRSTLDALVHGQARSQLSSFVAPQPLYRLESDNLYPTQFGAHMFNTPLPGLLARFEAFDYHVVGSYMRLSAGTFPQDDESGEVQALITREMANAYGLSVGAPIVVALPAISAQGEYVFGAKLNVRVVGIWEPKDVNDPVWNNESFEAVKQFGIGGLIVYQVLLDYDGYFSLLKNAPTMGMTQHWIYATQSGAITAQNMGAVAANVAQLRAALTTTAIVDTRLDLFLADTAIQLSARSQQLYILAIQILILSALFVFSMSILLVERQTPSLSALRTRGASRLQLVGLFAGQGVLLALLAGVLAPIFAGALTLALIHLFMPTAVDAIAAEVGAAYLPSQLRSSSAALPALAGIALGVVALTFAAWQATKLDVLAARRARGRSEQAPLWRRANLDALLLVVSLLGYLDLILFGASSPQGSYSVLGLFAPTLLLLAGALTLQRVFPPLVRLGVHLGVRMRGLTLMMALTQLARSPARYIRLALLLAMAVAIGVFSLNFDATIQQSAYARAAYAVGADIRLTESQSDSSTANASTTQVLASEPGVRVFSPVYRNFGDISAVANSARTQMLGIDPSTFGQVANVSWRSDFAAAPLQEELARMQRRQLPAASAHQATSSNPATSAAVWTLVSENFAAYTGLGVDDTFKLLTDGTSTPQQFVVGEIVSNFPTLYPDQEIGGFVVFNIAEFMRAVHASANIANEYWLSVDSPAREAGVLPQRLRLQLASDSPTIFDLYSLVIADESTPENVGNRGVLFLGGLTALLLAILGILAHTLLAARQRFTQFAVLRTLGLSPGRVTRILLIEQTLVYMFGVLAGSLLGGLLQPALVPFLAFGETSGDPTTIDVPPDQVVWNLPGLAVFYLALVAVFVLALSLVARYISGLRLSGALRFTDD